MFSEIKLKSNLMLSGNTLRLFWISLLSFVIRYGLVASDILIFYFFYKINLPYYYCLIPVLTSILTLFVFPSVRLGEQYIYFVKAQGGAGRGLLLFKFLTLKNATKAMLLYIKINALKLFWLCFFSVPAVFLGVLYYYLTENDIAESFVEVCILFGAFVCVFVSFTFWRISAVRYNAAPYYFITDSKRMVNNAVKKSIQYTDASLSKGAVFEYSFIGWVLSSFFIIPFFYVVPYVKLNKAMFIIEVTQKQVPAPVKNRAPIIFTAYKEVP